MMHINIFREFCICLQMYEMMSQIFLTESEFYWVLESWLQTSTKMQV